MGSDRRHLDGRQHLPRFEVGLEKATEEIGGGEFAATALRRDFHLGFEREHAGGHFRRRISMGQAAADSPTVTDGGVPNPGNYLAEQRCGTRNLRRGHDLRISGERTDPQHAIAVDDAAQRLQSGDIDEDCRLGQAHVETGEQTLSAGEQTRVVAMPVEEG